MKFTFGLLTVTLSSLVCASSLNAEDETPSVPSTDITVLSINSEDNLTKIDAGNVLKAIKHDGYDNQPYFSADGDQLYFTRMLGEQTDIFVYDFSEQALANITNTDEISEYSPTIYDETSLSVIAVNPKGQQHLRLVKLEDASQQVLNPAIEPVGYHAWLTNNLAAVFVLGDVMTLQLLDIHKEEKASPLADNIGRCLQRLADKKVSFTQLIDDRHHIFTVNHQGEIDPTGIILPSGVQDYAWWDSEGVVVGNQSQLWYISNTNKKIIAELKHLQIKNISRLAIDSNKLMLAIVHE